MYRASRLRRAPDRPPQSLMRARPSQEFKRGVKPAGINDSLPALRFEISEASRILRMSRAQLYKRIKAGAIKAQKDGARTYITTAELDRYVDACN